MEAINATGMSSVAASMTSVHSDSNANSQEAIARDVASLALSQPSSTSGHNSFEQIQEETNMEVDHQEQAQNVVEEARPIHMDVDHALQRESQKIA